MSVAFAPSIELPPASSGANVSVMQALQRRRTTREISDAPVSRSMLSHLLWAACGVNREVGPFGQPGRTAASASNSQEIDLYVLLPEGAYQYDAPAHRLIGVVPDDLREAALTRGQRIPGGLAPVQLVFVADIERLEHTAGFEEPGLHDPEVQKSYYFIDAGLIAGNVYLFAAAEQMAAWFHNCDRARLADALRLGERQRVLFAMSVGSSPPPAPLAAPSRRSRTAACASRA